jgi:cytochrome b involved in lipid metabolism
MAARISTTAQYKPELAQYTRDEVAQHASRKDCWIIINGKVYDVTLYLEEHPGSPDILLRVAVSSKVISVFTSGCCLRC